MLASIAAVTTRTQVMKSAFEGMFYSFYRRFMRCARTQEWSLPVSIGLYRSQIDFVEIGRSTPLRASSDNMSSVALTLALLTMRAVFGLAIETLRGELADGRRAISIPAARTGACCKSCTRMARPVTPFSSCTLPLQAETSTSCAPPAKMAKTRTRCWCADSPRTFR